MPRAFAPPVLQQTLQRIERRYRLPDISAQTTLPQPSASSSLAVVIEQARLRLQAPQPSTAELKPYFIAAMEQLIHDAMQPAQGDPAVQALVLQHRSETVREYVTLASQEKQDKRRLRTTVTRIAHPARRQRHPAGALRQGLAQLYESSGEQDWTRMAQLLQALLALPDAPRSGTLRETLQNLSAHPALSRLQRLAHLTQNADVSHYVHLLSRNGPRSGSPDAHQQGAAAQRRGAAVEEIVSQALSQLAQTLNHAEADMVGYRVVTSLRAPASLPGPTDRAKTEWDAVLLHCPQEKAAFQAEDSSFCSTRSQNNLTWNVALIIEAKASADAASSDLPRLRRGLRLLGQADPNTLYPCRSQQGLVHLSGPSLQALHPDRSALDSKVLYCSNAPADAQPRLLSAASRMLLLSDLPSLQFAAEWVEHGAASLHHLETLWSRLLTSPDLRSVLEQYPLLQEARALMVHPDDLLEAVKHATLNDLSR